MLHVTFAQSRARLSLNACCSLKHSFIARFTERLLSLMAGIPSHQDAPDAGQELGDALSLPGHAQFPACRSVDTIHRLSIAPMTLP